MKNSTTPTCYLIGQGQLLLNCAKILQTKSFQINAIISTSSAIEAWAQQQQINWVATLSDIDWDHNPADYLFSISNDQLIPAKVLQRIGCLSLHYHDAPLPRYAGSNSTAWAILQNETTYGISWHCIAPNVDSGDIVKQVTFPVLPDETVSSLNVKCTQHALEALTELAEELLNHSYQRIPQDRSQRSFFSRTQKPTGNGWLNWHNSADDIERLWRATQ